MFYQLQILSKKGKLARVWLAAHHEKKLTKTHVLSTDIPRVVEEILKSFESAGKPTEEVRMSLRLLGFLLLGTSRIYYKKADLLLKDCNDALVNIKLAFRPGSKPESNNVANWNAITMREPDEEMLDNSMDIDLPFESLQDIDIDLNIGNAIPTDSYQAPRTSITQAAQEDNFFGPEVDELPDDIGYVGPEYDDFAVPPVEDAAAFGDEFDASGDFAATEEPEMDRAAQDAIANVLQAALKSQSQRSVARVPKMVPVREDKLRTLSANLVKRNISDISGIIDDERAIVPRTKRQKIHEEADAEDIVRSYHRPSILSGSYNKKLDGLFSKVMAARPSPRNRQQSIGGMVHRGPEAEDLPQDTFDPTDAFIPDFEPIGSPGPVPRASIGGDMMRRDDDAVDDGLFGYEPDMGDMGPQSPGYDSEGETAVIKSPAKATHKSVTKRTLTMHKFLQKNFQKDDTLNFNKLVKNKKRATAAQMFFELLVLKTRDCVEVEQDTPYGDISVAKNPDHFDSLVTSS